MARETFVRVTLLEPFPSKDGNVIIGDGFDTRVPFNEVAASDADFQNPASCAPMGTDTRDARNRRKIDNSVPVTYVLNFADEKKRTVDVPISAAKRVFGDWDLVAGAETTMRHPLTWSQEKFRVALFWGDFGYPRAVTKGEVDLRKIKPPRMPKVEIVMLAERDHSPFGRTVRPHEIWNFDEDLDLEAIAEVQRRNLATGQALPQESIDISKLSKQDLAKLKKLFAEA